MDGVRKLIPRPRNFILCIAGSLLYCCAVNLFVVPMNLYSGGFMGIAQLMALLFPSNVRDYIRGSIYLLLNVPLLIFGLKILGKNMLKKTVFLIVLESIMLTVIPIPGKALVDDNLTGCIVAGTITGLGVGLTFLGFGSSGGTDILGLIFSKRYKSMSVGRVSIMINLCIYTICAFVFSLETAIYSLIVSLCQSYIIDRIHQQNNSVAVNIISSGKHEEIVDFIMGTLDRDVTVLEGEGAYSGKGKKLLISIMSEYELNILKHEIPEIDNKAFIFVHPNITVMGNFEKRLSR